METLVKTKTTTLPKPAENDDHWDLVIEPKSGFFSLDLRELWRHSDLLFLFVKRDFVSQYKQTILGPLWHLLQPLFTTAVFLFVFGRLAAIPTDGIPPVLFYMSGITLWNYFSTCLTATSNTFVANAGIFGKVYFPRLVMPLSVVLSNLVRFGIQFCLLLAAIAWYSRRGEVGWGNGWWLVPILVLMMAALGLGAGIIVSSLTTKYRDFTVLIGFAVQLLMYATPVAYPLSFLADKPYAAWIRWNPLAPVVETFRFALFGNGELHLLSLAYSGGVILLVLLFGLWLFSKVERTFMDTV